jgi:hypothetical protein
MTQDLGAGYPEEQTTVAITTPRRVGHRRLGLAYRPGQLRMFNRRDRRPSAAGWSAVMAGKSEVYKAGGKTGGHWWRLTSRNSEIVASGEAYD